MNLSKRLGPLFIFLIFSILRGQGFSVLHEYPSGQGLLNVLVEPDSSQVVPVIFIYAESFSNIQPGAPSIKLTDLQVLSISQKNQLLGVMAPGKLPANPTEPQKLEFSVYTQADQPRFKIEDKVINTGKLPLFLISDAKHAPIQISPNGNRLKFYDNHGRFLREKRFSQNVPHNYEPPTGLFNDEGNRFIFYTRIFDMENDQMLPVLYMLSLIGEEIWKYQLILNRLDAITISRTGNHVAVSGQTLNPAKPQALYQTIVFDSSGAIRSSFPYRATQIAFNLTETSLLIREEQSFKLIDLDTEGIILLQQPGSGRKIISDIVFLNDTTFAVALGAEKHLDEQRFYDNPEIDIFLTSGDRISHSRFDQDYSYSGKLLSSLSGEQLGFILQNRFVVLQREQ